MVAPAAVMRFLALPCILASCRLVDLHRGSIPGDHLYSLNKDEILTAGYTYEGVTCRVSDTSLQPASTTRTLYRFFEGGACGDHMLAFARETGGPLALPQCDGYKLEDPFFYVLTEPTASTLPLYRFFNNHTVDHLYTTSDDERDTLLASGDWLEEATSGYCLPLDDDDCVIPGYAGENCENCASANGTYPFCGLVPDPQPSPTVPLPQALQGHDDQSFVAQIADPDSVNRRYEVLATLEPGIRRYNFFWSDLEPNEPTDGDTTCPEGTTGFKGLNSSRQHCYLDSTLSGWDDQIARDFAIGAQQAAIMYSSPDWARHDNCTGFPWGDTMYLNGCVPREDVREDWEDYVAFLAKRYSGSDGGPILRRKLPIPTQPSSPFLLCLSVSLCLSLSLSRVVLRRMTQILPDSHVTNWSNASPIRSVDRPDHLE